MLNYSTGEGIAFFIIAILLFVGVFPLEYSYYVILRWVVFIASIYICFDAMFRYGSLQIIPLIICITFNPIFPIYMSKGIWAFVDILSGIYFLSSWSVSNK